jgi:hypothetical protein
MKMIYFLKNIVIMQLVCVFNTIFYGHHDQIGLLKVMVEQGSVGLGDSQELLFRNAD